jgi:hypothetical protein
MKGRDWTQSGAQAARLEYQVSKSSARVGSSFEFVIVSQDSWMFWRGLEASCREKDDFLPKGTISLVDALLPFSEYHGPPDTDPQAQGARLSIF